MSNSEKDAVLSELRQFIDKAKNTEASSQAIGFLFKDISKKINIFTDPFAEGSGAVDRRISLKNCAPIYFGLSTNEYYWTRFDINKILKSTDPFADLLVAWRKIENSPGDRQLILRQDLLNILDDGFDKELKLDEKWFLAILNISSYFISVSDRNIEGFYSYDNADKIRWLLLKGWLKINNDERQKAFSSAIENAVDYSMLCEFFRTAYGDKQPSGAKRSQSIDGYMEFGEPARKTLLEKVCDLASSNKIWCQADPGAIFWFWWGCGHGDKVKLYTENSIINDEFALKLMNASISFVLSTGGNYYQVNAEMWSSVYDVMALSNKARKMISNGEGGDIPRRYLDALNNNKDI